MARLGHVDCGPRFGGSAADQALCACHGSVHGSPPPALHGPLKDRRVLAAGGQPQTLDNFLCKNVNNTFLEAAKTVNAINSGVLYVGLKFDWR